MKRVTGWLTMAGCIAGGVAVQFGGCANQDQAPGDEIINYCVIFDCDNGALGGVIEWCSRNFQAFDDCP